MRNRASNDSLLIDGGPCSAKLQFAALPRLKLWDRLNVACRKAARSSTVPLSLKVFLYISAHRGNKDLSVEAARVLLNP